MKGKGCVCGGLPPINYFFKLFSQRTTQREGGNVVNRLSDSYDKAQRYLQGECRRYVSHLRSQI